MREVLQVLWKAGLTSKPAKCAWGCRYLQYLGHIVGNGKLAVPENRVTSMANFVKPMTKRGSEDYWEVWDIIEPLLKISHPTLQYVHPLLPGLHWIV